MREGETLRKGRREAGVRHVREDLFRAHYSGLLAFVLSQVSNLERAKEIAADAFAAVLEASPRAPVPVEPKIALFIRARETLDVEYKVELLAPLVSKTDAPRGPARLRRVEQCVRRLDRRQQGIISLRFDAGLGCREIGLVMGMSEVEVMLDVLRSLRSIKECMDAVATRTSPTTRGRPHPASG
jgi:DNA-directed RNA polymerase specialized sigma24 family protein